VSDTCVRNSLLSELSLLIYYASSVCLHWKNRRFTAFLDSKLHTRLAIVTANELGLAFPPRNLPKKFRLDPSTFYLVIVATDRQTYAGDSIIPAKAFAGIMNDESFTAGIRFYSVNGRRCSVSSITKNKMLKCLDPYPNLIRNPSPIIPM